MRCGLIGGKLGHSYSKAIHEALGRYAYDLLETAPEQLEARVRDESYTGFNVTIPYKQAVIPFCTKLSQAAEHIGSVNTLLHLPDGGIYGHNTDFEGFRAMMHRAGIGLAGKKVLILGSGGTSLTAGAVARAEGAGEVLVVSRSGAVTYAGLEKHRDAQVIINTTPVGMYPENGAQPVDLRAFPALTGVLDVIYNPLRTALIRQAMELGIPCSGGLYMLVRQAVAAGEIFLGEKLADVTDRVYEKLRAEKENIALIGMPGCGKTRLGGLLAKLTGRQLVDTDEETAALAGMPVPEIITKYGEARFRQLEKQAVAACAKGSGLIIATGGGVPLFPENRQALAMNSRVFWIQRDAEKLAMAGRPLSKDRQTLYRMEKERTPYYRMCADGEICNDGRPEAAAQRILDSFLKGVQP